MKTVIIDNFDSFTYNLVHYIEEITSLRPTVYRNNAFDINCLEDFDIIVLSPGPGLPKNAGLLMQVIEKYYLHKIILGVCLGHQALGEFFGAKLKNLTKVFHGVDSEISELNDTILFNNMTSPIVGRYHSWVIKQDSLPKSIKQTSVDSDGEIMSIKHIKLPIHGMQFHPESILTPEGKKMLQNFFQFYAKPLIKIQK